MHWPAGLREFPELDSTNEEARRLALAGETGPLWLRAARQTAGRGRRGREWHSDEGNLFATLLLRPARPKAEWAQLSFVTAIAAADMAAHFAPAAAIAVKWPNDVLAAGAPCAGARSDPENDGATVNNYRKLAGILLETAAEALIIGIGINLKYHPSDTEFPAISIAALGATPPTAATALALLAPAFARWYDLWDGTGFAPIRDAWLARAAGLGQRIRARLPGSERAGLFEGIDEEGALLLNEGTSTRAVTAGEVFFG